VVLSLLPDDEVLIGDISESRLLVVELAMQTLNIAEDILFESVKVPIKSTIHRRCVVTPDDGKGNKRLRR